MKLIPLGLIYLSLFLLGPSFGWADNATPPAVITATPVLSGQSPVVLQGPGVGYIQGATTTPAVSPTQTVAVASSPTGGPSATPDPLTGRKYYAFDAVLKNPKDSLSDPEGIAISPSTGNLIIADTGNNRVVYWDENGVPIKTVGSFGPQADWQNPPQFSGPCGVYEGGDKKLYVGDTLNNRVVIVDENGLVISTFGVQGMEHGNFNQPRGITADSTGDLWVLDTGNSRVEIFTPGGDFNSSRGTFGTGDDLPPDSIPTPFGAATPTPGPHQHHRGQSSTNTFVNAGQLQTQGKTYFNNPLGIAVNNIDQLIVADTGNFRFEVFNHEGAQPVTQEGWYGEGPYQFKEPAGVAVTKQGWVVIADGQNGGINLYNSRNGEYEFIGAWRAKDENILPNYQPQFRAVACDSQDRIYLTDIKNNLIVRLKPVYDKIELVPPTATPTTSQANPYGGNGYPIR